VAGVHGLGWVAAKAADAPRRLCWLDVSRDGKCVAVLVPELRQLSLRGALEHQARQMDVAEESDEERLWDEARRDADVVGDAILTRACKRAAQAQKRVVDNQVGVAVQESVDLEQEAPVAFLLRELGLDCARSLSMLSFVQCPEPHS
jgi:hypothetical protein